MRLAPSRSVTPVLVISLVLLGGLLVLPGADGARFAGAPLSQAARVIVTGLIALAGLVVLFRPKQRSSKATAAALSSLVLVKLLCGHTTFPKGWQGVYEMIDSEPPAVARFFTRFHVSDHRIDDSIRFRGTSFGLHFLNNLSRYNTLRSDLPRDIAVPLRITWTGYFYASPGQIVDVFVQANGALSILIEGQNHLDVAGPSAVGDAHVTVGSGWRRVRVVYHKPANSEPAVFCKLLTEGTPLVVTPWPAFPSRLAELGRSTTDVVVVIGAVLLFLQFWMAYRPRDRIYSEFPRDTNRYGGFVTFVASLVLLTVACYNAHYVFGRTVILGSGDDPLAYESNARNVMEEGLMMPSGAKMGEGEPYFFYPLYSYALAAAHWLIGEDFAAVVLFNGVMLATLPHLLWLLGWRRLPWQVVCVGQVLVVVLVVRHFLPYSLTALTDNLFVVCALATLAMCILLLKSDHKGYAFFAGVLAAASAATRPSFLMFVFAFAAVVLYVRRSAGLTNTFTLIGLLGLGYALGLLPFVLRNYMMSGKFVVVATLWHALPYSLIPPEVPNPWEVLAQFQANPFDPYESLRMAFKIVSADPIGVTILEMRKIGFTLGLTNLGPAVVRLQWEFPILFGLFLLAVCRRRVPAHALMVIFAFIGSHLVAMVIAYPWTYGYKSILPVQLLYLFGGVFLFKSVKMSWITRR